jgi:glutaminyl-tRNA synthetase
MYRILHAEHHRTGDTWCIYPMYDFAHGQCDSIEGITHSLCSLEYEDHRPLYDWFLQELGIYQPRQMEFARMNVSYTVLSKRRLLRLVNEGRVSGWDDPRMPTLAALRRRGYTPEAIRDFVDRAGVAKTNSIVDIALQEHCLRQDLNVRAPRRFAVLRPLKMVLLNYPEGQVEEMECINNPEDASAGTRRVPFSRELYVERDDYREDAPRKWYRLAPGREVRLRYAYFVTCVEAIKDEQGEVVELHCTYDPQTRGGSSPDGRKVRGTIHWVSAAHAAPAEVRLYERLFSVANPLDVGEGEDWIDHLNPDSLEVLTGCQLEPGLAGAEPGSIYQFERNGYFCVDSEDSDAEAPVLNRSVSLRDSWSKIEQARRR